MLSLHVVHGGGNKVTLRESDLIFAEARNGQMKRKRRKNLQFKCHLVVCFANLTKNVLFFTTGLKNP